MMAVGHHDAVCNGVNEHQSHEPADKAAISRPSRFSLDLAQVAADQLDEAIGAQTTWHQPALLFVVDPDRADTLADFYPPFFQERKPRRQRIVEQFIVQI